MSGVLFFQILPWILDVQSEFHTIQGALLNSTLAVLCAIIGFASFGVFARSTRSRTVLLVSIALFTAWSVWSIFHGFESLSSAGYSLRQMMAMGVWQEMILRLMPIVWLIVNWRYLYSPRLRDHFITTLT